MQLCLHCGAIHHPEAAQCPNCGLGPHLSGKYRCYAPELLGTDSGFCPEFFQGLAAIEADSFWFRVRNELIIWALGKNFPDASSYLEIGCGTGFVLSAVSMAYPHLSLCGSDVFVESLPFAEQRAPHALLMQMDARKIPFFEHFDVIGAFDVLEHIWEDDDVLGQVFRALRPGGGFLISVPQHPWLWSPMDDYARHKRRYTDSDLREKLGRAGFSIVRSTSFVSLLLPCMLLSRLCLRLKLHSFESESELNMSPGLNRVLEKILRVEHELIKGGISFPLGGSRLIVARRPESGIHDIHRHF